MTRKLAVGVWLFFLVMLANALLERGSASLHAQGQTITTGAPWPKPSNGAPSGSCGPQDTDVDTTTGNFYTCKSGAWQLVSSGGGGSGTVSGQANGVIPLATGATTIGAQSHLSDNGTNISASEPFLPQAVSTLPSSCTAGQLVRLLLPNSTAYKLMQCRITGSIAAQDWADVGEQGIGGPTYIHVEREQGGDIGGQIKQCVTDLQNVGSGGGYCDARAFQNTDTVSTGDCTNGALTIPEGITVLQGPVRITLNCVLNIGEGGHWRGLSSHYGAQGFDSTLICGVGVSPCVVIQAGYPTANDFVHGAELSYVTVDGNKANQPAGCSTGACDAVFVQTVGENMTISHVNIRNGYRDDLHVDGTCIGCGNGPSGATGGMFEHLTLNGPGRYAFACVNCGQIHQVNDVSGDPGSTAAAFFYINSDDVFWIHGWKMEQGPPVAVIVDPVFSSAGCAWVGITDAALSTAAQENDVVKLLNHNCSLISLEGVQSNTAYYTNWINDTIIPKTISIASRGGVISQLFYNPSLSTAVSFENGILCAGVPCGNSAAQTSAATNFGTALGTQTIVASVPVSGVVTVTIATVQSLAGVSCSASSNTVTPTLAYTAPGGTAETLGASAANVLSITGNGAVDSGDASVSLVAAIVAKAGTAVTYTTASVLGSSGCSPVPQYTVYAKATY